MAKLSPKQKKIAAKAGDPNKIEGVDFAKMRQEKEGGADPMQMSDKVGYTMQYGKNADTDTPTTFRTDAVMRMAPMLMTHNNKPVDTSNYSADTSAAYSQGSFQGSQGGNFLTDRNETTSTSTEVIPGEETTNTRLSYKEAWDQNIIEPGQTKGLRDRYEAAGLTFEDYAGGREEQREDDPEGFEADLLAKTKVAGGPGKSITKTDDQIIETTNTEVDESPRTVQTTQKTVREIRKDKKAKEKLDKDLNKTSRKFQRGLKGLGMEGLTPGSKEYQAKYNELNQFDKDKLDNLQRNYDTAKTSKQYFFEGKDQNASFGDQFNTGERETFAQTDFRNQKNQKQRSQNYADMFQQSADRIGASNLADLSSNTSPDSDIINNIFGSPSFMIKPMQFRAQEGSKTSRTGKSKSGGLNRKNNY